MKEAAQLSDRAVIWLAREVCWSGPPCFRALGRVECAVRGSRGGANERGGGVVTLPKPGRRLWACFCAGAAATIPRKRAEIEADLEKTLPG